MSRPYPAALRIALMPVRTRPFAFVGSLPPGTLTTLYTVPSGRTAIVKHFGATNRTTLARHVRLGVRSATGVVVDMARGVVQPDGSLAVDPCELALGPGDELWALLDNSAAGTAVNVYAGGSLLEGAPS